MTLKTAIDISNWSGEVTEAQFKAARLAGCSRVIVALNNLPLAQRQLRNAVAAGLETQVYIYYYFAQNVADRTRSCLAAIEGLPVKRVWIDCEDEKHSLEARYLANRIRVTRDLIRTLGYEPGIYTAAWWWNKYMAGITEFADLPLWDALWDKDADIDAVKYGGWVTPEMSQHTNDTHFAGIWCDINSYRGAAVPGQPPVAVPTEQPPVSDLTAALAALAQVDRDLDLITGTVTATKQRIALVRQRIQEG